MKEVTMIKRCKSLISTALVISLILIPADVSALGYFGLDGQDISSAVREEVTSPQSPVLVDEKAEDVPVIDPEGYEEPEPYQFEEPAYNADTIAADAEEEQEYRDSVDYVEQTIVFSVIDYRKDKSKAKYLSSWSKLCREYKLKKVEMVIEVKTDKAEVKDGYTAYQVFYKANVTKDEVWSIVDELSKEEGVMSAEPDYIWENTAEDDMTVASAEEISFCGWDPESPGFDSKGLDCKQVWNKLGKNHMPGEGVVVAVIDTGVDYNHRDLAANMWTNPGEIAGNGRDDDGNGYIDDVHGINLIDPAKQGDPMDDHGHGTHVAGIIGMTAGNGGGVGVAYGSKIMAVKAGQANGSFASTDIAKAIQYAAANGADVINMSFGGTGRSSLVEAALADAFGSCVLVAAAGNDGLPTADYPGVIPKEDFYPAGYNYVLGVMASHGDDLAAFSNWDVYRYRNCEYELAAPGVSIVSTLPGNRYASWSGTSMAAPIVSAAAAIIRREKNDKSQYSSRYIMGQLSGATNDVVYGAREYPLLNIIDSINNAPQPRIAATYITFFDSKQISAHNNGDGVVQAGETIDIGLSLWNACGIAKGIAIRVDNKSIGGIDNPYIELVTDEINLQDEIGTFATGNNGYLYEGGMLVGANNPLRIKVSENAPNGLLVPLNFLISYKNGMDEGDKNMYKAEGSLSFEVQKGEYLRGFIKNDMTLTSDKLWIIDRALVVPKGVTVSVDPGTKIQFYSAETGAYAENHEVNVLVKGIMRFNGTYDKPIEIFPSKGYESREISIQKDYLNIDELVGGDGVIDMDYVKIVNPNIAISNGNHLTLSQANKDVFYYDGDVNQMVVSKQLVKAQLLKNSKVSGIVRQFDYVAQSPYLMIGNVDTVLFNDNQISNINARMGYYSATENDTYYNNVFLNNYTTYHNDATGIDEIHIGRFDIKNAANYNAILNDQFYNHWFKIGSSRFTDATIVDVKKNYWGTEKTEIIEKMIFDINDSVSRPEADYSGYLTLNDDMSSIYPFVTEAFITDASGENRLDTVSGSQTVQVHVRFNRDMAREEEFEPMVSFGPAEPYTDFVVQGDWVSDREWVGTKKIDPFIDQGTEYIRIKDAAAADDHWLLTGTDAARFSFEISKTSAEALTLQGNGGSNCNYLNWVQDDYDTLAGYNLYRTTSCDKNIPIEEQSFRKVNSSIIANDVCDYTDNNVEQGQDYYYYFTVVDTAFNESEPSNVVKCTPNDLESPVIVTKAIPTQTEGRQIKVAAEITDNVEVTGAKLFYKMAGSEDWTEVLMRNTTGNTYQAAIAGYDVEQGTLQYYIVAEDGTNTSYAGTAENPNVITVSGVINAATVSLSQTSLEMTVGGSSSLTATVLPDNVTDPEVSWSSSDDTVVTVDKDGNVIAVSVGEATITATSADGKASAICNVTVDPVLVSDVSIDPTEKDVYVGESFEISASVLPENATNKAVEWDTSDPRIATVDNNGKVTAKSVGEATITVSTEDASEIEKTCKVTVKPISVKAISVAPTSTTLNIGEEADLTATIFPDNATNKNVTWTSNKTSVATVDNGKVTALKPGSAVITATSEDGGFSAICNVRVTAVLTIDIALNKDQLKLNTGDSETLTVTNEPENASSKDYVWKSTDKNIAKVSNGVVTAVSPGQTYISCTTTDGTDITKVCSVEVYEKQQKPAAPVLISKSLTTVTLKKVEGALYSIDGETWVESNKFTGLTENTEYTFWIKLKKNGFYLESDVSDPLKVKTDESTVAVSGIEIEPENSDLIVGDTVQLTAEIEPQGASKAVEWKSTNPAVAEVDENGLVTSKAIGHTYIVCKAADDPEKMAVSTIKVYDISDTPDMPEVEAATENAITLTAVNGLEYKVEGEDWGESSKLTGLEPNTDYNVSVRIAANGFHKESKAATAKLRTTDHDWADEISVDVEPTYYEEGSGSIHCKVCGAQKEGTSVTIPVKAKEPEWLQALADKDAALLAKAAAEASLTQAQSDLDAAQAAINTLNQTIDSKDATIEEKEEALAAATNNLQTATAALTKAQEDLDAANSQLTAAANRITELEGSLDNKDEELTQAKTDLATAQSELEETSAALTTATSNYNTTKAALDSANETITSLRSQLSDKESALTQALADKDAALLAKAAAEASLTQAQSDLDAAQAAINTLNQTIDSKDATIEEKEEALAAATNNLQTATAALTKAQKDLDAANSQLTAAANRITELEGSLDNKDEELTQAKTDLATAQSELATATENYNNTKSELDSAVLDIADLNKQLSAAREENERLHNIIEGTNLGKATISGLTDVEYTASAIEPEVEVALDGKKLVSGTDYTVYYVNNISVGTATIIVTGEGNYNGVCRASFNINPADIKNASVSAPSAVAYTGSPITPYIGVSIGGRALTYGADYTVAVDNNVAVGTAKVTITGKGNYRGKCYGSFAIAKADNTLAAIGNTVSVKAKKVKKKKQTISAAKAFSVSNAKGGVTYRKLSGNKKVLISSDGVLTVKKGLKKGKYVVGVEVTASGDDGYKAVSKPVTVTIRVK